MRNLIFIGVVIFLTLVLHWYIWRFYVRAPRWPRPYARAATTLIRVLGLSLPVGLLLSFTTPRTPASVAAWISYSWLGLLFYLIVTALVWDIALLPARLWKSWRKSRVARAASKRLETASQDKSPAPAQVDLSRRRFLARTAALSSLAASGGLSAWGVMSAFGEIETPEVLVRLPRFPAALNGYRIALVCDLHVGPILGRDFVAEVVDKANRLRPDLTVIVGDLVDGSVEHISSELEPISRLRARHGVYFVTGNHEYYSGADAWIKWVARLGIPVLMNQRVAIGDVAPGGACFDLIGVPDYRAGDHHPIAPDMRRSASGRDPERELVVLAHQPIQVYDAAKINAGLQLSGHTHGGQLTPFGGLTRLAQPYLYGLHQHTSTTKIYVSRGAGFWGPPIRVLAPPEVTAIILHS